MASRRAGGRRRSRRVCYRRGMRTGALDRSQLATAAEVLAAACPYDRAAAVAGEKLFGAGPPGPPRAFGAWDGGALVGVAAVAADRLRVLAVLPGARGPSINTCTGYKPWVPRSASNTAT
jgi:hypothetical protein